MCGRICTENLERIVMKLYFYYGVMGSSKSANCLMTKFNFEEHGQKVVLMKPSIDTREGANIVKSRAGLSAPARLIDPDASIIDMIKGENPDIIMIDEAQFLQPWQVDELRELADNGIRVFCYGLRADFRSKAFPGSLRLFEVCDTMRELVSMCKCGKKATMNVRYADGKIVYDGEQIVIGGSEQYTSLCHRCWKEGRL
ncbi:MAG: thymidine kinase [Oscillospiraceae bacterium]|nr:thymidine kinase [Oscillospiraceae bacterium]